MTTKAFFQKHSPMTTSGAGYVLKINKTIYWRYYSVIHDGHHRSSWSGLKDLISEHRVVPDLSNFTFFHVFKTIDYSKVHSRPENSNDIPSAYHMVTNYLFLDNIYVFKTKHLQITHYSNYK